MYVGGTYTRLVYSWYQNIFHVIAVLIVFHAANGKKWKKTILKQDSKSRKEDKNVDGVANPPGSSSLRCRTTITPLLLRCISAVAPLSNRYCSTVDPLLLLRCRAAVAPLSLNCRTAAVAPDVATQSHRYCTAIAPLSLRCCCCCYAVTPLLLHCRSTAAAVAPAAATVSLLLLLLLSLTVVDSRCRIRVTVFIVDCQSRVSSLSEGCSTSQETFKVETY